MGQNLNVNMASRIWRLRFHAVLLVAPLAAVIGCSKGQESNQLPVFPVVGHLSVNGQTPAGAFVVLHPKNGTATAPNGEAVHPRAVVKPDGSFAVGTYKADDGAPSGEYSLTVEWR